MTASDELYARTLVHLVYREDWTPDAALNALGWADLSPDAGVLAEAVQALTKSEALQTDWRNVHTFVDVNPGEDAVAIARSERYRADDELTDCVRRLATPREAQVAS